MFGPCGTLGCRCTLEGPVSANHSTPDAADVLRAVAARLSSPAASSAPVETSSGAKRRHQAAHLGPDYDGRKKGARGLSYLTSQLRAGARLAQD